MEFNTILATGISNQIILQINYKLTNTMAETEFIQIDK